MPSETGTQRISVSLNMKWVAAEEGVFPSERQFGGYAKAFEIEVEITCGADIISTNRRRNSFSIIIRGNGVILITFWWAQKTSSNLITRKPNVSLQINSPTNIILKKSEQKLIQTVFQDYDRVEIEKEFLSGYSGARTLLFHPLRINNKADAPSIV